MPPLRRPGALCALFTLYCVACASLPKGRSMVDRVAVEGTSGVDAGDIEERLATVPSPRFLGLFPGFIYDYEIFDRLALQRDLARIERYYRARGYYDARVRAARIRKTGERSVRVEIVVEENEPVRVGHVAVAGALPDELRADLERMARRGLALESPFEEGAFENTRVELERALTDRGYARAKVTRDAAVDLIAHRSDVTYSVDSGPACVFGTVTIEGLGSLPKAPVQRALKLFPGEPYSTRTLEAARQAEMDLGVFSSVDVVPMLEEEPKSHIVPIRVRVEPSKLRAVRLGGGVEFDAIKTDAHLLLSWEDRNFFGGLRRYRVTFRPGLVFFPLRVDNWVLPTHFLPEFQLSNELRQPGFIEGRTNAFIRPEVNMYPVLLPGRSSDNNVVAGYVEVKTTEGLDRVFWRLFGRVSHTLQVEVPFSYVGPSDPRVKKLVISFPELITNLDLSDSRVRPHRGAYFGNSLQFAGGIFGGDAHDIRIQPEARGYIPLGRKVTLAIRGGLGFLFPVNYAATTNLPFDDPERVRDLQIIFFRGFYAGGPNSNRGYPLRGIGPYEVVVSPALGGSAAVAACTFSDFSQGSLCRIPVGGPTLWEASAEVRFDIAGPFSAATFCDAADVSPDTLDIRLNHPHLSCGAGTRYDTPLGPIRLDIGYRIPGLQVIGPTNATDQEPNPLFGVLPVELAFGIGEAF